MAERWPGLTGATGRQPSAGGGKRRTVDEIPPVASFATSKHHGFRIAWTKGGRR
jgi:hypothetical protein